MADKSKKPTPSTPNPTPISLQDRRQGDQSPDRRKSDQGPPRGGVVDRRMWPDRRSMRVAGEEQTAPSGLERRRGAGRRLSDFTRSAEEGELTKEQFLFLMAVEAFKKANHKQFPTWTDVLEIVRLLGYRKTMAMELTLNNAEDWREAPNTPSNVRPERWHERAA